MTDTTTITSAERVLQAATRLFAEKGYRETSIRDIAAEVGLNVATVQYHIGSKEGLYRKVIEALYEREQQMISEIIASASPEVTRDPVELRKLMEALAFGFIERSVEQPESLRIWAFHWLDDPGRLSDLEAVYSLPLYKTVLDVLLQARSAQVIKEDEPLLRIYLVSFMWFLYGYFTGRRNDWGEAGYDPYAPQNVAEFKTFVRQYLQRMLTYSDTP